MPDDLLDWLPFVVGWTMGWLLLWHPRALPRSAEPERAAIAVVIPARNEAHALPALLAPLVAGSRAGDEIVVVDDHSTDATAAVAASFEGVRVLSAPDLPDGWLGKPHACWHGASSTTAPVLVFLDADVRPPADLLDRVAGAVASAPEAVVSVQPSHVPGPGGEQLSLLCNVVAVAAVGRFSILRGRATTPTAYGPVLALTRATYERVQGHAAPSVRRAHTEDVELARTVGRAELYTGAPDVTFRMYPGGLRDLLRGWTRSIVSGATSTPWWAALATAAWVWSLAGGWLAAPVLYPVSAVQVWVLGRRVGRFSWWTAVLFPLAVLVLLVVTLRSLWAFVLKRDVRWKDRSVAAR
ncbi:MAG: glycosyltransferase family 2 protein [Ilumatobacteraceae bacterium]|jgi:4,4'-diaponeurosporenoate glycosyltransferase|nr:glycosyltransferase family 2 protein [Ilumatobacteraceae bacterium]